MAQIIFVKTEYHEQLEQVYSRLMTGTHKEADVVDPYKPSGLLFLNMPIGEAMHMVCVKKIGANSFGLEVFISYKGQTEWTALEQFNISEQLAIASAIDWSTLK